MKLLIQSCLFFIGLVPCIPFNCYGLEYGFAIGSTNEYNLKYGEAGGAVSCVLTVACVGRETPVSGGKLDEETPAPPTFTLKLTYKAFKCSITNNPSLNARLASVLRGFETLGYTAEIDQGGTVLKSDIEHAIFQALGDADAAVLVRENVFLPLAVETWQCVLPYLGCQQNGKTVFKNQRRWAAVNSARIETVMNGAETGMQMNVAMDESNANLPVFVLWQEVSEKKNSFEYGKDADVLVEHSLEVRFLPAGCIADRGWVKSRTTIRQRDATGVEKAPFVGEGFFEAARIQKGVDSATTLSDTVPRK